MCTSRPHLDPRSRPNSLDEANFGRTTGLLAYFTIAGAHALSECELFAPLEPFWRATVSEEANAFTLNVLRSEPAPPARAGGDDDGEPQLSAGGHFDDTLRMALPRGWNGVAHATHVLYLQVPADMTDGTLELWEPDLSGGRHSALQLGTAEGYDFDPAVESYALHEGEPGTERHPNGTCQAGSYWGPPAVTHTPEENSIFSFRGDAMHRVLRHRSAAPAGAGVRISLVIEEYILPEHQLGDMPPFHVEGQDEESDNWPQLNAPLEECRHLLSPLEDLVYQTIEQAASEYEEGAIEGGAYEEHGAFEAEHGAYEAEEGAEQHGEEEQGGEEQQLDEEHAEGGYEGEDAPAEEEEA